MRRSNSRNSNSMVEPPDADFMMDAEMMDDEDEDEWENGEDDYDDATNDDDDMVSLGSSVPTTVASAHEDKTTASQKARKLEQQRVFSSKLMVITAFVIVTIAVTVSIYGLSTKEQNESLESKFQNYANQIFDVSSLRMEDLFNQVGSMGVSFSAFASGWAWPYVTILNFQPQASNFFEQQSSSNSLQLSVLVTEAQRPQWQNYSVVMSPTWIKESNEYLGLDPMPEITPYIYNVFPENGTMYESPGLGNRSDYYAPVSMVAFSNVVSVDLVNYDTLDDSSFLSVDDFLANAAKTVQTPLVVTPPDEPDDPNESFDGSDILKSSWPQSTIATALFDSFDQEERKRVATLSTQVLWDSFFQDIFVDGEMDGPISMALEDTCGKSYMYEIEGSNVVYKGSANMPVLPSGQPKTKSTYSGIPLTKCSLVVHLAASNQLAEASTSNKPVTYTLATLGVFFVMAIFFCVYDRLTGKSYVEAMGEVERSKSIVASLFPSHVRDRVLNDKSVRSEQATSSGGYDLDGDMDDFLQKSRHGFLSKPIADLHPSVTVLFADVANFTAWASVREPSQVFLLLETLYHTFDKLCRRYKIFKVETIGDCYVAVAGLPEFTPEHAVNMARFAQDIMIQMHRIVKQLEVTLGPETADLTLRIGIHSGPVTAGVLRGEKSRFQLFGDTVNTASRMESTGMKNRIQVSSSTAVQIEKHGKKEWLVGREDAVPVKGKGDMKTFWLHVDDIGNNSYHDSSEFAVPRTPGSGRAGQKGVARKSALLSEDANKLPGLDRSSRTEGSDHGTMSITSSPGEKKERLVNWGADLLLGLLKRIVAMRESEESLNELREFQDIVKGLDEIGGLSTRASMNIDGIPRGGRAEPAVRVEEGNTVLDEVAEIISLPKKAARYQQDPGNVELGANVVKQLYRFVREIARQYRDNPFHNFDHASHVTQSLTKLLSRVVAPDEVDYENMTYKKKAATSKLHKFTFGITSDPITQFACAFSALIHDLDHPGVPNAVLVSEHTEIAKHYKNKSVAEQNSVDLAWSLLMEPRFKDLRQCIYTNQSELDRFRQLVVNSVMATDIVDKELGASRKKRWERAFNKSLDDDSMDEKATDEVNRKATIVIEHLIQAADVAHTMQHWHVYLKWNERFFHECYAVYLSGRSASDPSEGWYKGEIGFFDFYIIPLAKKLENCGVFGVSSDECLNYAQANREEWERKGEEIVKGYLAKYKK